LKLLISIPITAAFLIALLPRRFKNSAVFVALLAALALSVISLRSPAADALSHLMLVIVNIVSCVVLLYSLRYMQDYTQTWSFYSLFLLMLAGLNGVIIATDIFGLYVCLELASISGYLLVAFGLEPEALEASFKYAIMGALASIFILLGIALLYSYTSTLNMAEIAITLAATPKGALFKMVSILFLAGFGLKAALVPFHAWLPDAHSSAPTPVSAVLSGVFVKTLGIYALMRVFFTVLGISTAALYVFMILGLLSMAVGAFLAFNQNDIKRLFAYSTISQVGYIVFALGIGSPLAILGALFHVLNHAAAKSLLFLNAGAIQHATGERSLDKLGGLGPKLPLTSATSFIGAMSISGIPPLGGFWSKLIIIIAAVQAGYVWFAVIAALVSIITLIYYMRFQNLAFFGPLKSVNENIKEGPFSMKLAVIILALFCILGGLLLLPGYKDFLTGAVNILVAGG